MVGLLCATRPTQPTVSPGKTQAVSLTPISKSSVLHYTCRMRGEFSTGVGVAGAAWEGCW